MEQNLVTWIKPGDHIELESKLGKGRVLEVLQQPDPQRPNVRGTFPMIRYKNSVTGAEQWCTYLVVLVHRPEHPFARSATDGMCFGA